MDDVIIVGGGIGGLTLALMLHQRGIGARVYESAPEIEPVGVGISLLPHASKELGLLGLEDALSTVAVTTTASRFFNRFGQLVYSEPVGRFAGYDWPQFQIHRGDLQQVLYEAYVARVPDGAERVVTGHRCVGVEQDGHGAVARFVDPSTGRDRGAARGAAVIGCDGIGSAVRRQFFPDEGPPIYSGVNMWRGVTVWEPFLGGSTYLRAGWLTCGKMVIYPIRHNVDGEGRQLVNWVAEVQTDEYNEQDWNRIGRLEDFYDVFADWTFDWLDVAGLIRSTAEILEYPMVDRDPLPRWSHGRVTLLGDAAHPMYPRGSNGAGQAVLDAYALAECLQSSATVAEGLKAYEDRRLGATAAVVRASRAAPPDVILQEVHERTGDRPFERIEDVITPQEMAALSDGYKRVAGYDRESLTTTPRPKSERKPAPSDADVIVVGAGIMGASIAFGLAVRSDARVLVIDERPPVGGISGRTFGQVRQHYSNRLLVKMAMRGFEVIGNWREEVGVGDPGYARLGYLLLVAEDQLDALRRNVELGQSCGVDTRFVSPGEIAAIEPLLITDDLAGGAYEPDGGYVDVTKMVLSWLMAARMHGAEILAGVEVTALRTSGDDLVGVSTSIGDIDAPVVVTATGAWGGELLDPLGVSVPLQRRRLDMAVLEIEPGRPQLHACVTDGNSNIVVRPDMGRHILAVAYPDDMATVDDPLAPGPDNDLRAHLDRLDRAFAARMPTMRGATVVRHVSGAYDVTPDYHPVIGWAPEIGGLFLALGFSGHGLKLSPAVGEIVAAAVLGHEPPFDIGALRLGRFDDGDHMFCAYGPGARA